MSHPKILFLAGSVRTASINKKLAISASEYAKTFDANVHFIDLVDFEMPLYNGDLEEKNGMPENAKKLKKLFFECDGFFIASPEYNSSITPLLKNVLDWISRPEKTDKIYLEAFVGKVAAIGAASPGALGGMRGLIPLRLMLSNIGVIVLPDQVAVVVNDKTFDEKNILTLKSDIERMQTCIKKLIDMTAKIKE